MRDQGRIGTASKERGLRMADESLLLRGVHLALACAAFTLTIETTKRPIRFLVESSPIDPVSELLALMSALWTAVDVFSPSTAAEIRRAPRPAASECPRTAVCSQPGAAEASVGNAWDERPLPEVSVHVDDMCASCRDGWLMAEELKRVFPSADLWQPCKLCSERAQVLSRLERTLLSKRGNTPSKSGTSATSVPSDAVDLCASA